MIRTVLPQRDSNPCCHRDVYWDFILQVKRGNGGIIVSFSLPGVVERL